MCDGHLEIPNFSHFSPSFTNFFTDIWKILWCMKICGIIFMRFLSATEYFPSRLADYNLTQVGVVVVVEVAATIF